ncbi:DUF937 domain-containing protein [Anabaena cylindrica FACHB-243]|uniref:DUF937 domain-containing protein n=1 Tax=Anabaena cylindrica (strain ATCC 27899 / PCC 7122) TaxID=272123 RepID=K9ZNT2_ANACC|nr:MULTISPECIES: DUF937 domain-containing protein [Anabaena]AFZ59990.1 hypothetical protein Anacy_4639 [Anabaena cylindrica PCC 7122]MBD2417952.1 DUF937 domain-containing protein [Anabaena cylindrica FACHB-243]MBY5285527.1 DUF937 domain-containing protein [Anabaena sp. CCAP 1446/1C]MBY5307032.1 DUF937 domain-containing protein [Anabaena sp. CCAP 1446/1C]MCM2404868.1 DUF937 domain-containing protein [Anabaena sp. CCAP 1446/1C]
MGLFDQILGSVTNSNQQGGLGQLVKIANTVQQVSNTTGADTATIQSILTVVGKQVHSSLQEKQATEGTEAVQNLVNQFAGTSPDSQAVNTLFSPAIQQQVAEIAAQRTGLDVGMIQQLLPTLVPLVLSFLQSGGNPLLNKFLDADGDGDVDIADAMKLASRFLGK